MDYERATRSEVDDLLTGAGMDEVQGLGAWPTGGSGSAVWASGPKPQLADALPEEPLLSPLPHDNDDNVTPSDYKWDFGTLAQRSGGGLGVVQGRASACHR